MEISIPPLLVPGTKQLAKLFTLSILPVSLYCGTRTDSYFPDGIGTLM